MLVRQLFAKQFDRSYSKQFEGMLVREVKIEQRLVVLVLRKNLVDMKNKRYKIQLWNKLMLDKSSSFSFRFSFFHVLQGQGLKRKRIITIW